VPPLDDDLFDGIGLFDFDAKKQSFVAVTIPALYRWPCEGNLAGNAVLGKSRRLESVSKIAPVVG
jgi:hypothetical protein